jgi:hypothetical protein
MENRIKYEYRLAKKNLFKAAGFIALMGLLVFWMMNRGEEAQALAWVIIALNVPLVFYMVVAFVHNARYEKAVYIAETYVIVPNTDGVASPPIFRGYKNIRIPYEAISRLTTSYHYAHVLLPASFNSEFLHIHCNDESTTLISSMFENETLFHRFKAELCERLKIELPA